MPVRTGPLGRQQHIAAPRVSRLILDIIVKYGAPSSLRRCPGCPDREESTRRGLPSATSPWSGRKRHGFVSNAVGARQGPRPRRISWLTNADGQHARAGGLGNETREPAALRDERSGRMHRWRVIRSRRPLTRGRQSALGSCLELVDKRSCRGSSGSSGCSRSRPGSLRPCMSQCEPSANGSSHATAAAARGSSPSCHGSFWPPIFTETEPGHGAGGAPSTLVRATTRDMSVSESVME